MPGRRYVHQVEIERAKTQALRGLLDALWKERIPLRGSLYTGQIEEYFHEDFLPIRRRALLEILREIGIPHDSHYRFVLHDFYDWFPEIDAFFRERIGLNPLPLSVGSGPPLLVREVQPLAGAGPVVGGGVPRIVGPAVTDQYPRQQ